MLQDLDSTLKQLLEQELPSGLLSSSSDSSSAQITIDFVTPGGPDMHKPVINFFLYDIRENVELRSGVSVVGRREDGIFMKTSPPVFVDCSYLITVWLNETGPEVEHSLLGEIMKVLLRHSKISTDYAPEHSAIRGHPIRATALRPGQLMNLGEFWQSIGSKPKAALHYTVTIAVSAQEPVEMRDKPVLQKIIGIKPGAGIPNERLTRDYSD